MKRCLPAMLVTLMLVLPVQAFAARSTTLELDRDLTVTVHAGLHGSSRGGIVLPMVMEFENVGANRVIAVQTGPGVRVNGRFHVPAAQTSVRFLYVPVPAGRTNPASWCTFRDVETGIELGRAGNMHLSRIYSHRVPSTSGMGKYVPALACLQLEPKAGGRLPVSARLDTQYGLVIKPVSPRLLPGHWIGLSGIDVIVTTAEVLRSGRTELRALADWTTMGGVLLVHDWTPDDRRDLQETFRRLAPFTQKTEKSLTTGMGGMAFVRRDELTESHPGYFENHLGIPVGSLNVALTLHGFNGSHMPHNLNSEVPQVKEDIHPPFWLVFLALMLFSALVGPLGWWYFVSHRGVGLIYYAVAPGLCLVVMILVIGADIIHEGFRPYVSCRAVRFIDQPAKRSVELSQFGVYAPFLAAGRLKGKPGELPHFFRDRRRRTDTITVRREDDGVAYRGALPARRRVWYGRERTGVERRRLVVRQTDGEVQVENHTGCDLENLVVSYSGRCVLIASLANGERKTGEWVDRGVNVRNWERKFNLCKTDTVLSKSEPLYHRWANEFKSGDAWVAEVVEEEIDDQVWLKSRRVEKVTYLMFGVL